ncbi:MAG: hypothetical protein WCO66_05180 [Candidatus Absconditabacteria bacterium]
MPSRQGDKEENVVIIYLKRNGLWYENIYKNVILYYYHGIMAPIDGDLNVTRENAGEVLKRDAFKNLTREELMILSEAKIQSNQISMESRKFEPDIFKGEKIQSKQISTESGKFERAIFQKREERQIN